METQTLPQQAILVYPFFLNCLPAHYFTADIIVCAGTWIQIGNLFITSNSGSSHSVIALTSTTALGLQEGSTALWDQQGNVQIYASGNGINGISFFSTQTHFFFFCIGISLNTTGIIWKQTGDVSVVIDADDSCGTKL